ncbi:tubulin binding protein cofactor A-like protein [Angomonas deanei]|nr:tubulin binding protein cofactor A-like protein [Angomonas deanei]|eukprot:EPY40809.1 tubulin binding protein cofactor A-like protein [Angomonas deanei]
MRSSRISPRSTVRSTPPRRPIHWIWCSGINGGELFFVTLMEAREKKVNPNFYLRLNKMIPKVTRHKEIIINQHPALLIPRRPPSSAFVTFPLHLSLLLTRYLSFLKHSLLFIIGMSKSQSAAAKTLSIKTNAVLRNIKDLQYALKETETETARLEKMKEENSDKVSQQENVVAEAKMMIPNAKNRIRASSKDLSEYLEKERAAIDDAELLEKASGALTQANEVLGE